MQGNAYNVGDESMNLTKMEVRQIEMNFITSGICSLSLVSPLEIQKLKYFQVAKLIEKNVEGCSITEGKGTDADKRDYEVSYAKIKKLGHETVTVTVDDGIKELLKIIPHLSEADLKIMKNV